MPGSWQDDPSPMSPRTDTLQEVREEDDPLGSRESTKRNERGYSDGPIKIYDSGVYLYLEPTREEASRFDVVINVAKEVVNPFATDLEKSNTVVSALRQPLTQRQSIAEPMTAISEASFHSAFEVLPSDSESPTTPKADRGAVPEYIHVPWDHNSEILDDLDPLCQLIDERVSQGKSVLVHCQLGASRSASLVIAYGLHKNPDLDFNDMYGIVKDKSCWVGPNMSLIYQLTDFRSRMRHETSSKPPNPEWFKTPWPAWNVDLPVRQQSPCLSLSVDHMDTSDTNAPANCPPTVTPGPSLSCTNLALKETPVIPAAVPVNVSKPPPPSFHRTSPRPFSLRERYETAEPPPAVPAHDRFETRPTAHVRYPSVHMDLVMSDIPASPSLLSPKVTSFLSSPLARTIAGDLAGDGPSVFAEFGQPFQDPRSPPQQTEPLIMRNIDEYL
jgi:tyrosine-protein phosphatase